MSWQDGSVPGLSEDDRMLRDAARNFARDEVAPRAAAIDRDHAFPEDLVKKMSELGFLGALIPAAYSGSEISTLAYALIIEELAAACATTSIIMSAHNSLAAWPIAQFGSEEQKQEFLPAMASGASLGCFALSEPGSGTDSAAMLCTAKRDGDDYIIQGTKNWITNGPKSGICVLLAMQDAGKKNKGITAFVHPMNLPGISLGKLEHKLGICGSATSSIQYTDVRLPAKYRLGEEGQGFAIAMHTLNGGRIGVGAQALGIARASLADAMRYGKERKTFGKAVVEHQSIQNYLAEMITQIDAARHLVVAAAKRKDEGFSYVREAAMAKLFASQTAMFCADKGLQIHGGYGYVTEYPAERHYRDAKITEIYEGTSEIQKLIIAQALLNEDE